MATDQHQQATEYHCPGERSAVSRAVHLGRLARFYPACRRCPHRDETGALSARRVRQLAQTRRRAEPRPLFDDEGAAGVYLNELSPAAAGRMAAALGIYLRRQASGSSRPPAAVVAGDGRPLTPEVVAAVGEGLRWAGCHVIDIGPATAPCVAFTIDQLQASGGILVGNGTAQVEAVGLKFWADGARPLSAGGRLDVVRTILDSPLARPTRKYGSLERYQAEAAYLAGLAEHYHALRPLEFLLDTQCLPLAGAVAQLTGPVACRVLPARGGGEPLADQVLADGAHFAVSIDDDGQRCRLTDDRGRELPPERLFLLVARHLLSGQPGERIVVEHGTSPGLLREIRCLHGRPIRCRGRREAMERAMRQNRAVFGGGRSGRFWYQRAENHYSADALMTLTFLLRLLSQSDRPLSQVLDAEPPLG